MDKRNRGATVECFYPNEIHDSTGLLLQKNADKYIRVTNLARLIRSQIYCILSTGTGLYYILDFAQWPNDLIHLWNPSFEVIFEIAASQWLWSLVEDVLCGRTVVAHMIIPPGQEKITYERFSQGLFYHHIFTVFAFTWSLCTHKLAGLCVFGLLFEAPVLFMNMRDLFSAFHHELKGFPYNSFWCRCFGGAGFQLYALVSSATFIFFRFGACLLWPTSLIFWRRQLSELPIGSHIVYHILGASFCYVNIVVFFTYVIRYLMEDMVRMNALPISVLFKKVGETEERSAPVVSQTAAASDIESSTVDSAIASSKTEDSAVRFFISGQLYDVSSFLEDHPGGREVLLHAARSKGSGEIADATAAFNEIGHSKYALEIMKRYLVQQNNDDHGRVDNANRSSASRKGMEEDIEEDDETTTKVFERPYKIGVDYTSVASVQALSAVALYIFVIFFLTAGFRNDKNDGYSKLDSLGNLLEHVQRSLSYTFFPLIIPAIFFIFAPSLKHLLHWQSHLAAIMLSLSLALEFTLLRLDDKKSTGLQFIRISMLLTFSFETVGRRMYPVTRALGYPLLARNCSNVCAIRGLVGDALKRVLYFLTDIISLLLLLASAAELLSLYYSFRSKNEDDLAVILVSLVTVSAIVRFFTLRLLNFSSSGSHDGVRDSDSLSTALEVAGPTLSTLFLALVYSIVAFTIIPQVLHPSSEGLALPNLVSLDLSTITSCLYSILQNGQAFRAIFLLSYSALTFVYVVLPAVVAWAGPHFMSQFISLATLISLWPIAAPLLHARWLSFSCLLIALHFIAKESVATLKENRKGEAAHRLPYHLYALKQLEDEFRSFLAHFLIQLVFRPLLWCINLLVPDGLLYYMYPLILADMGPRCDYGVALQINGSPQGQPKVFQLNVAHLDGDDLVRTTTSTRDMMQEILQDPEVGEKGFVSDLVALFPLAEENGKRGSGPLFAYREVNLSSWTSEKAAHDWYVNSPAHKQVVRDYKGRKNFGSFSAMFAALSATPQRPLRWEVRCRGCKATCKTLTNDQAMVCPTCGKTVQPMPFI